MLDMEAWMAQFVAMVEATFPNRVWFVGLQGSRARDEGNEESDLDVVVILDTLTAEDIADYRVMLDALPERALLCGFLSGREELVHWPASELFQFCHDTRPYLGSLDAVLAQVDEHAVREAVHIGVGNIYHGCVHNMVHETSPAILRDLYKAARFVIQAIVYLETGRYVQGYAALMAAAAPTERAILVTGKALKEDDAVALGAASSQLFCWAQGWLIRF